MELLPQAYYEHPDVVDLAQSLLGCVLVHRLRDGTTLSGIIAETEAYRAPEDRASHAYANRRTQRTVTMFGPGGRAYVYLCYGIHHLFNVVTGPEDMPHAVLIRAVEPLEGIEVMLGQQKVSRVTPSLTNGPGKWTRAFGITAKYDGYPLHVEHAPLGIYRRAPRLSSTSIINSPRVGIDYAGAWKDRPWRFRIKGSIWAGK